jgi:hypothetical protein
MGGTIHGPHLYFSFLRAVTVGIPAQYCDFFPVGKALPALTSSRKSRQGQHLFLQLFNIPSQ